jgi:heme-degrading monooxygenase HmoA
VIRHIVAWNFLAEDEDGKVAALAAVRAALEPLVGVVPGLVDLRVVRSASADAPTDRELGLVSHHEDLDALRVYATHPAHVAAGAIVREHTRDRVALDYEV